MRARLNKTQMKILSMYVYEYRKRGVMGEWREFVNALEVALKEIKLHRRVRRKKK